MREWWMGKVGPVLLASAICAPALAAQGAPAGRGGPGSDVCSLATSEEFQRAHGIIPQIGVLPDSGVTTQVTWGWHCDYSDGAIDLFMTKSPSAELERVLTLTNAPKQRTQVPGLGHPAFFTGVYPDDKYRRRGLLAINLGSRILALSMDAEEGQTIESTRPKLEGLAKLILPRVK